MIKTRRNFLLGIATVCSSLLYSKVGLKAEKNSHAISKPKLHDVIKSSNPDHKLENYHCVFLVYNGSDDGLPCKRTVRIEASGPVSGSLSTIPSARVNMKQLLDNLTKATDEYLRCTEPWYETRNNNYR